MTPAQPSPVALLDQLDELRASATPGPWVQCRPFTKLIDAPDSQCMATADNPADAALIVAAVNAIGPLADAVRAVLELADDYDDGSEWGAALYRGDAVRTAIRTAIRAALSVTP